MKKIKDNYHLIFLSGIFLLSAAIHLCSYIYGDDLIFAQFFNKDFENFKKLTINHFMNDNGRMFIHFIDEFLLIFQTKLWAVTNSLCICGLIMISARISCGYYQKSDNPETQLYLKKAYQQRIIIISLMFSLISIYVVRESVLWITGSLNYLFPAFLFIAYFYFYKRSILLNKKFSFTFVLAFLSAYSTEQASVLTIIAFFYISAESFIKNKKIKIKLSHILNLAACVSGFLLLMLAPGNMMRISHNKDFYELSLFGKIALNLPVLFNMIFSKVGACIFISILFICIIFYLFSKKTSNKKINIFFKISAVICIVISCIHLYLYSISENYMFDPFASSDSPLEIKILIVIFYSFIIIFCLSCIFICISEKKYDNMFFLICCILSQASIVIVPTFGSRNVLIFILSLFIPLSYFISKNLDNKYFLIPCSIIILNYITSFNKIKSTNTFIIIIAVIAAVLIFTFLFKKQSGKIIKSLIVLLCFSYTINIGYQYYQNLQINLYNENILSSYENKKTIHLKKLPDSLYAYTMPYDDSFYYEHLKKLYNLPKDLEIIYE